MIATMMLMSHMMLNYPIIPVQFGPPGPREVWVLRRMQPWGDFVQSIHPTYDACLRALYARGKRFATDFTCVQELR